MSPVNAFAEELILAGGCFWCLEHDLESLKGINFVQSGYSGGDLQNPTYENHEGHQEVVLVNYDSKLVNCRRYLGSILEILILWTARVNFVIVEILTGQ
jgi:peptide-methionine (S)-S-oxide reductase